jgi:hypothetical protein
MGGVMERKRWETAIRCLEIAVHPHTSDKEVIAAINGYRRTAGGAPLSLLYRDAAGATAPVSQASLDRLTQEISELYRKLEAAEAGRIAALRRAQQAQESADERAEEVLAAEHRADRAEQQLAEFQGAYGRISGGLQTENSDLRRALDEARRNLAQPIHEPVRQPFQAMLNAALDRPGPMQRPQPRTEVFGRPWTA